MRVPRVAYFPDSFHEVNGVAHTSRNFAAYAQRQGLPFLCVRASAGGGTDNRPIVRTRQQEQWTLELQRSPLAVRMEKDLWFDPLFWRYAAEIERELHSFEPDVIHVTGPSELGIFGAYFAWKQKRKLAASWHTNLHEYAARRLQWLSRMMSLEAAAKLEMGVEAGALKTIVWFYHLAGTLYAPNEELCAMLEGSTGKPCHLMQRGVDTVLFRPSRRTRWEDGRLVLGYVGRLSIEKNVALLVRLERELHALGVHDAQFLIVGHGNEEEMLRRELRNAKFAGVLRGEALAAAYANMDVLVFPSHTDTFGNVVLEALASGVPAVVTPDGGPKFIVREGETGFVAPDDGFALVVASLARDRVRLRRMREAARAYAMGCSWDAVFQRVYAGYSIAEESASVASLETAQAARGFSSD
ncbi:MAG TPA: glycosyltransferase [Acidobacteriaceae bacterium]|jgi:glycosyltransferase involved in cell wall biosynthesis